MAPEVDVLAKVREKRGEILHLCALHGARNPRLFGSMTPRDADPESGLHLLAEFKPGRSLFDQAEPSA